MSFVKGVLLFGCGGRSSRRITPPVGIRIRLEINDLKLYFRFAFVSITVQTRVAFVLCMRLCVDSDSAFGNSGLETNRSTSLTADPVLSQTSASSMRN